jgi:endonuclease/exonuclease/phosphatase family metal-dependent hydrolase
MPKVRVATFNCENLFARFKFKAGVDPDEATEEGWDVNETAFQPQDPVSRRITAEAMKACDADVLCLEEVENLDTLKRFRTQFLGGYSSYPHLACVDGNDPRLIDVAVMSRLPIVHIRSYQHLRTDSSYLFSRDCLEVDLESGAASPLTLFVNHLKSMMGGRAATRERRRIQAEAVKEIVTERFGAQPSDEPFVVLGDLNDYIEADAKAESGITSLVEWDQVENVVARLPEGERWTHYYASGGDYRQLDYLLPSRALATSSPAAPEIVRGGDAASRRALRRAAVRWRRPGRAEGLRPLPTRDRAVGIGLVAVTAPGLSSSH